MQRPGVLQRRALRNPSAPSRGEARDLRVQGTMMPGSAAPPDAGPAFGQRRRRLRLPPRLLSPARGQFPSVAG
eukprot:12261557-Heterocapsa_arctica.AAC.1